MKVVYLASGAADMYCGSCMRDNRLAAALIKQKRDVTLIPLYTPLRTDEPDVSDSKTYYGGINVFLQQRFGLFRRLPSIVDRPLDWKRLLNGAGRFASGTDPATLGAMTQSVLAASEGRQAKELRRLLVGLRRLKPDLVNVPNLMFVGVACAIREALGVPVVCTLSGEDIFLDAIPDPFRQQCFDLVTAFGQKIDAFVAVTDYYATHAAKHFGLPVERVHVVPMGIDASGFDRPRTPLTGPPKIGYLARICPEKGLAQLAGAFVRLRDEGRECKMSAAGYLGRSHRAYLGAIGRVLATHGLAKEFTYKGEVSREEKIEFLRSLDILCVPTLYPEAKGFYILEAMAAGVPVVQPRHGSFPEIVEPSRCGLLYNPDESGALEDSLRSLLADASLRAELGSNGAQAVRANYTVDQMANSTWSLYEELVGEQIRKS